MPRSIVERIQDENGERRVVVTKEEWACVHEKLVYDILKDKLQIPRILRRRGSVEE